MPFGPIRLHKESVDYHGNVSARSAAYIKHASTKRLGCVCRCVVDEVVKFLTNHKESGGVPVLTLGEGSVAAIDAKQL